MGPPDNIGLPDHQALCPAPAFDVEPARAVLQRAMAERVCPAVSIEVGSSTRVLWREAAGGLTYDPAAPRATPDTVFDLASLTKVIATATIAMRLAESRALDLAEPIRRWFPDWAGLDREPVTVRDLLEHASGLPAWLPLYRECRGREAFARAICRTPLAYAPRSESVYSDLGFILLGLLLETIAARPLDAQLNEALPREPSDHNTPIRYLPPAAWRARTAPAQISDERGPIEPASVDDTNAWALGGVAGHAGLFGTAPAVGRFARALLATLSGSGPANGGVADPATLRLFLTPSTVAGSSRALAWDTMRPTSSCGTRLSPSAAGHTGFTGTSLWIDPERQMYVVLLTNRVYPRATDVAAIQALRRAFHDAVVDAVSPRPA